MGEDKKSGELKFEHIKKDVEKKNIPPVKKGLFFNFEEDDDELLYARVQLTPPNLKFEDMFWTNGLDEAHYENDRKELLEKSKFIKKLNQIIEIQLIEINPSQFKPYSRRNGEAIVFWKVLKNEIHNKIINYHLKHDLLKETDLEFKIQKLITKTFLQFGRNQLNESSKVLEKLGPIETNRSQMFGTFHHYHSGLKLIDIVDRKFYSMVTEDDLHLRATATDLNTYATLDRYLKGYEEFPRQQESFLGRMYESTRDHIKSSPKTYILRKQKM